MRYLFGLLIFALVSQGRYSLPHVTNEHPGDTEAGPFPRSGTKQSEHKELCRGVAGLLRRGKTRFLQFLFCTAPFQGLALNCRQAPLLQKPFPFLHLGGGCVATIGVAPSSFLCSQADREFCSFPRHKPPGYQAALLVK